MHDFTRGAYEDRYRSSAALWSGRPNAQLVAEAADLAPGTALDVGCGEGADALWLAERGWRVTGVDFADTALARAAGYAEERGPEVAARVCWEQADLTAWTPPASAFDLVSAHFFHLPGDQRRGVFGRLADAVAPGGTLLIVGHSAMDLHASMHRPDIPGMFWTAEEIADSLDADRWNMLVAEARPRPGRDPEGRELTLHDAVLRACRRR
ncbi:Methyltransferase domain-containing protein [Modestobacter sp. DSM 44400]|nr:Methyltransferase domain-containing protein [Modestobacter sp. DSM 44400]